MVVGTRVGTCNGLGGSTTRLEAVKGRTVGKVGNREVERRYIPTLKDGTPYT